MIDLTWLRELTPIGIFAVIVFFGLSFGKVYLKSREEMLKLEIESRNEAAKVLAAAMIVKAEKEASDLARVARKDEVIALAVAHATEGLGALINNTATIGLEIKESELRGSLQVAGTSGDIISAITEAQKLSMQAQRLITQALEIIRKEQLQQSAGQNRIEKKLNEAEKPPVKLEVKMEGPDEDKKDS